jgi:lipoic acid synthetase
LVPSGYAERVPEVAPLLAFAGVVLAGRVALAAVEGRVRTRKAEPKKTERKPEWLRVKAVPEDEKLRELKQTVNTLKLATVCEEAQCPNLHECWSGGTGTIMLMGDTCTRGCKFCSVSTKATPDPLDESEPESVAEAVASWGLDYIVITTVDRDDLPDQGCSHISRCIKSLRERKPEMRIEVLMGDFQGKHEYVAEIASTGVDVYAHNLETVLRLTEGVRDRRAGYFRSLSVLAAAKQANPKLVTKSSIMLGLGETDEEVAEALKDLRTAGVDVVTFGQYLQPTPKQLPVFRYVRPEEFMRWKLRAETEFGFAYCASGPLVRSSYRAGEFFMDAMLDKRPRAY